MNVESTDESDVKVIDVEIKNDMVNSLRNDILKEFDDVVTSKEPTDLPPKRNHEHRIVLIESNKQVNRNQYPLSYSEKEELTKVVDKLLQQKFIRVSDSPYNSPVLFVKKKDGTMRMCIDYRLLNNNTVKDRFPLPRIEQIISKFESAVVYSKLDLMSGYYQVRIQENDIPKTAFSTDYGHYEWVVMPFGLTNAPATFQRMMNTILAKYLNSCVQVYLDDIFIYSKSYQQHALDIKNVLTTLRENSLIAKKSKCAFFYKELRFLGHVIAENGIKTDPDKIDKVKNWPIPTTIKEAQMFLGLTSYYRRFIKNHSKIAIPIYKFITKDSKWTEDQTKAFNQLKSSLINSPILVHPKWNNDCTFVVHTDACGSALGYTLEQLDENGKTRGTIAYGSKKLIGAQLNYGIYDREFMAVIEALRNWRYYLLGRHFIIITDHKSLVYLRYQNVIDSARVSRWLDYLSQYDFEIQYIPGKENSAADALSRYPHDKLSLKDALEVNHIKYVPEIFKNAESEIQLNSLTVTTFPLNQSLKNSIIKGYKKDKVLADVYYTLKDKTEVPIHLRHHIKHYEYKNDLLYYKTLLDSQCNRLVIPHFNQLPQKIIKNAHSSPTAGHFGPWKTYNDLMDSFFWFNMMPTINKFCKHCEVCQKSNTSTQKTQGLFSPLPVPQGRWTDVTMDFVTGLPTTDSANDMIMVITDRFSKMSHFIPTVKTLTAESCAKLFLDCCIKHHGFPRKLTSDKDIRFMNRFWYTIHFLFGTSLLFSTTNHPQTDGQTERVNRILNQLLRKHCSNDHLQWDTYLPMVEFAYNSTYQDSIKCSPFELAIGYKPDSMKSVNSWNIADNRYSARAEEYARRMRLTLTQVQDNIVQAQRLNEKYHNRKHRFHDYKVGEYILLHRDAFGANPKYYKIQPAYYGPFRLVKKINDNAFEVDLPIINKKDRVLNIKNFRPFYPPLDLMLQAPRTDAEILSRINEMCGIAGLDEEENTFDVYWRDCDPFHATTITADQFNTAKESLRHSLFHNAKMICAHEQVV